MQRISATDAKNRIGELWEMASHEPVTVERNGTPTFQVIPLDKYVAVPVDEYQRMKSGSRGLQPGFAADLFEGVNVDELLAVDIAPLLEGYLPA